jgi:hypothetical protein
MTALTGGCYCRAHWLGHRSSFHFGGLGSGSS